MKLQIKNSFNGGDKSTIDTDTLSLNTPDNINRNSPAWKLAEKEIPTIAKDVLENGEIGTAGIRLVQSISQAVIKENKFYNKVGKRLRGSGARTNLLQYFTRKGWHPRQRDENFDFLGMSSVNALSENIKTDLLLETEGTYSVLDLKDTEKGFEILWNMLINAFMVELPVEYEKRAIDLLEQVKANGVKWNNDNNIDATALPEVVAISYATDADTKTALATILNLVNKKTRMENPLIYKPEIFKWELMITPEFDDAIQRIGAYEVVGGDKTYGNFLSNKPTKFIKGGLPVDIDNSLPISTPFVFKAKSGAFNNIDLFYTNLHTNMLSRMDFIGQSAELKFAKFNTDEFSFQASYWAVKTGLIVYGSNADYNVSNVQLGFKGQTTLLIDNGGFELDYKIKATDASALKIVLMNDQFEEVDLVLAGAVVIDGTLTSIPFATANLPTGSYTMELRDGTDLVYRTATMVIRNKNYQPAQSGETDNGIEAVSMTSKKTIEATKKEDKKTSPKKVEKEIVKDEIVNEANKIVEDAKNIVK